MRKKNHNIAAKIILVPIVVIMFAIGWILYCVGANKKPKLQYMQIQGSCIYNLQLMEQK